MNTLWASLFWGSIGLGFFIYGKKQKSLGPLVGGILMMAGSYFIDSALTMSLVSVALIVGIYWFARRGD